MRESEARRMVDELRAEGRTVKQAFALCDMPWFGDRPPMWADLIIALIQREEREMHPHLPDLSITSERKTQ